MPTSNTLVLMVFMTFFGGGVSALFWARLNRLELEIGSVSRDLRAEIQGCRAEMRTDLAAVRDEIRGDLAAFRGETQQEFRAVRADLTQVALVAGGGPPPRASQS